MTTKRRKPPVTKQGDQEQYRRFLDAAKVAEADSSHEAFDRAFQKVVNPAKPDKAKH